jgi:hypothetical protein
MVRIQLELKTVAPQIAQHWPVLRKPIRGLSSASLDQQRGQHVAHISASHCYMVYSYITGIHYKKFQSTQ